MSKSMHDAAAYRFYTYRLLPIKGYDDRPLTARPIPKNLRSGLYGPIYVSAQGVLPNITSEDRICVVIRDPRTIISSWYDSILKTHAKMGNISETREKLAKISEEEGMNMVIDHALNFGTFEAMEEWMISTANDERIKIVRFEDVFSSEQEHVFKDLLHHFKLTFDTEKVSKSLAENSFSSLAKKNLHYKQGNSRKWNERLTSEQIALINSLCPRTIAFYDERR
jgi:hypothetical protein